MTDERKNIDKLFSDSLGNYSPTPPPELWSRIDAASPPSGKTMKTSGSASTYWMIAVISTVVISGLAVLWYFSAQTAHKQVLPKSNQQFEEWQSTPYVTEELNKSHKSDKTIATTTSAQPIVNIAETLIKFKPSIESAAHTVADKTLKASEGSMAAIGKTLHENNITSSDGSLQIFQNEQSLENLRRDFLNWLSTQPAFLAPANAASAFNMRLKISPKPPLPISLRLPVIGSIYAAFDLIDYGKGFKKQSKAIGFSFLTSSGPWLFETGAAYCLSDDNGRFMVNYNSFDSIGFYNRVISFSPNPSNPGTIQFNTEATGVFDSIHHNLETSTLNRYTYLQIPFAIGYHIYSNRLITVSLKAGPVFSVMLNENKPSVSFYKEGANLQSIESLSPDRISTNWQIAAGLSMGLHLSRRFTFTAEPTFKSYLRPVYQNNRTKPQSIGIKAGLLYRF